MDIYSDVITIFLTLEQNIFLRTPLAKQSRLVKKNYKIKIFIQAEFSHIQFGPPILIIIVY